MKSEPAQLAIHRAELGDPTRSRTGVYRMRTCRPRPLDDGAARVFYPT